MDFAYVKISRNKYLANRKLDLEKYIQHFTLNPVIMYKTMNFVLNKMEMEAFSLGEILESGKTIILQHWREMFLPSCEA